jgi:hypothetical protein
MAAYFFRGFVFPPDFQLPNTRTHSAARVVEPVFSCFLHHQGGSKAAKIQSLAYFEPRGSAAAVEGRRG